MRGQPAFRRRGRTSCCNGFHLSVPELSVSKSGTAHALFACRHVIHAAGVVSLNVPQRAAFSKVIEPTLRGVEHVLGAVNRTPSVETGAWAVVREHGAAHCSCLDGNLAARCSQHIQAGQQDSIVLWQA